MRLPIPRPSRYAALLLAVTPQITVGQQPSIVAKTFVNEAIAIHEKLVLAADAMPADAYSFKPTPEQATFAEIVWDLDWRNDNLCSRIAGVEEPDRPAVAVTAGKERLLARLRETVQSCERAMLGLDDSKLGQLINADLRIERIGPLIPRTRAAALTSATAYWADMYAQLAQDLRLNRRVPPKPCGGVNAETTCGSGRNLCQARPTPGVSGLKFGLSDAPYAVRSDGLGPYAMGVGNVLTVWAGYALVMVLGPLDASRGPRRTITLDLDHPVPGDIGIPLGVLKDDHDLEVAAQWYSGADQTPHSAIDIPIGTTVYAAQTDVEFHINGIVHSMQMGPQPAGHCFSDVTAVYGTGTSRGTITRSDSTTWVVDLPSGSIGRLFDVHLSYPNAVNKGLYYVSLHFVLKK